jgi:glycosyltransferase involved in cell wall biosynthesis
VSNAILNPVTPVTRVLVVVGNLRLGGTESYIARLAPELKRLGIDIEVCVLERTGPLIDQIVASGVPVHSTRFVFRRRPNSVSRAAALLRCSYDISRLVRRRQYDVVHSYLFLVDVVAAPAARLAGCRRIIVSRRSLHRAVHPPGSFYHGLEQVANRFATEVIANSRAVLKDAETHEGQLPARRAVIYNGVDAERYQPARLSTEGPIRLLTVGSLAPLKGQEYAIEALALLTGSGIDATLDLVGAGPDEATLRSMACEAGVGDRVNFAGEQLDPRSHLARADIFVLPSRVEGFSNALLEAMASALPVVATDVGGNPEALLDGLGGRIVPPQRPGAIANAVSELASDRPKLVEMGQFNRRRVADLFSLKVSARNLADVYVNGIVNAARLPGC